MWQEDKRWSDRFLPEVKRILGECLIGEAPQEDDRERNTDLIVLHMDAIRIACRLRRHQYLVNYPDQITVRSKRPTGVKSELAKIIEGWGDYMFYGFANETETGLAAWVLIDLSTFRLWLGTELCRRRGQLPGSEQANADGSSKFRAFRLCELPPEAIVARQEAPHDTPR